MEDRLNVPSITGTDLEFEIAGPGGRSYAFIVDWHIRLLVALAYYLSASLAYAGTIRWFEVDDSVLSGYFYVVGLPSMAIYFLYHPILEILMDGRTPGKRIAGVRIVMNDGQAAGVGAHLIRNVFRLVDSLPFAYVIGFATTLFTERNVRLGDLAAGTLLIYDAADERSALQQVEAVYGARTALPEAELVQEMIDRWDALDTDKRYRLGRKLLARLGSEVPATVDDRVVLSHLKAYLE